MTVPGWDAYLWPSDEPGATVLRNKFGLRNRAELTAREYAETSIRQLEIEQGRIDLPRTGDADEWRAIHRHLFGNVYDWAGDFRDIDMNKGGQPFLSHRHLDIHVHETCTRIQRVDWPNLDRAQFVDHAARAYMQLNFAHPFREGNGRAARIFLSRLTTPARYDIDYELVDADHWNNAARQTMGESEYTMPTDHLPLVAVFDTATIDRDDPNPPAPPTTEPALARDVARVRTALRAQNARPARDAVRDPSIQHPTPPPPTPDRGTGFER